MWPSITSAIREFIAPLHAAIICRTSEQSDSVCKALSIASTCPRMRRTRWINFLSPDKCAIYCTPVQYISRARSPASGPIVDVSGLDYGASGWPGDPIAKYRNRLVLLRAEGELVCGYLS